jgi:hypothetical protein
MKTLIGLAVAALTMVLTNSLTVFAADPYYPYPVYDDYYKKNVEPQPPPQEPANAPPSQVELLPVPPPEQPIKLTEPPEFLFPPGLGFGVAVGIPEDLFYVSKAYYTVKGGRWYRALFYNGPWGTVGLSRVPPELKNAKLAKIHDLRNREFRKYWKNKNQYKGKVFRPGEELRLPMKDEKRP